MVLITWLSSLMFAHQRHQLILDAVRTRSPVPVATFEKLLKSSPATVRRDLAFLERLGKIIRTHGGVLHPDTAESEVPFDRRERAQLEAKLSIGQAAAALISPGQTVFVDAGSTALEAGRRLLQREHLTVFTNSVPLLSETPGPGTRVIAVGGEVRHVSLALVGGGAMSGLDRLHIDIALLGASGLDCCRGPSTTELSEAEVKRTVANAAKRVVVVADASKWNVPAAIRFAEWSVIHDLITDHAFSRAERVFFAQADVRLHSVKAKRP